MSSRELKKILVGVIAESLKIYGYARDGNDCVLKKNDLTFYINVQSEMRRSTSTIAVVTVNIRISSSFLFKFEETSIP